MERNFVFIINPTKPHAKQPTATTHSAKMMTKTILFFTVASVLLSNVVSDIQVFTDYDELAAMDPEVDPEDMVTKVQISNDRALETTEPADRYQSINESLSQYYPC